VRASGPVVVAWLDIGISRGPRPRQVVRPGDYLRISPANRPPRATGPQWLRFFWNVYI